MARKSSLILLFSSHWQVRRCADKTFLMSATARLLQQRSVGEVKLHFDQGGVTQLRESGASKVRLPRGSHEAILINTGGGIAGGDSYSYDIGVGQNARLTVTSQAAERVYQTLGPLAAIATKIRVGAGAALFWLPQETIFYDGAALRRDYFVEMDTNSNFLAVEPLVFGRSQMGETVAELRLRDTWRIWRGGSLTHADDLKLGPGLPLSKAALAGAGALATIVYLPDDAERRLPAVLDTMHARSGASAWNGKLIARILAEDGYMLRKQIISALGALAGTEALPKIWTM